MSRCVVVCCLMTAVVVRCAVFVVCCLGVVVWSVLLSGSVYCMLLCVSLVRCVLFVDYWLMSVVCDCLLSEMCWYCVLVDVYCSLFVVFGVRGWFLWIVCGASCCLVVLFTWCIWVLLVVRCALCVVRCALVVTDVCCLLYICCLLCFRSLFCFGC